MDKGKNMAQNQQKIDLNFIVKDVCNRFIENRNSSKTQSRKTQYEKDLANSVNNMLLNNKQGTGEYQKISILTRNKYLSKIRSALTDLGYKHHSFDVSIQRLIKSNPEHEDTLNSMISAPLKDAAKILDDLKESLFNQLKKDQSEKEVKKIRQLHEKLSKIVIVPTVISFMAFNNADRKTIKDKRDAAIKEKQTKLITLKMSKVINLISELLSTSVSDPKLVEKLALGVSLATGRRQIETCVQGTFEKADDYEIKFSGQAKARGDMRENIIPSLAPVDVVLDALKVIRNSELIEKIKADMKENSFYTANEMFNNKSRNFTILAEKVFIDAFGIKPNDQTWVFKDSRAIYAKTAYEIYKKETLDKNEQICTEDIFFTDRLGHTDTGAKENYKAFEIIADDITKADPLKLVERTPEQRLEGLKDLLNNSQIQQNNLEKNLDRVIEFIEKNPIQNITKFWLRKDVKGGKTIRLNLLQEIIEKAGLAQV